MKSLKIYHLILTDVLPSLRSERKSVLNLFITLCSLAAASAEPWVAESVPSLAQMVRVSTRTIYRAKRRLQDLGLIAVESGGGRETSKISVLTFVPAETPDEPRTNDSIGTREESVTLATPDTSAPLGIQAAVRSIDSPVSPAPTDKATLSATAAPDLQRPMRPRRCQAARRSNRQGVPTFE